MKKYKFKTKDENEQEFIEEIDLEDKDFLLIRALETLGNEIRKARIRK